MSAQGHRTNCFGLGPPQQQNRSSNWHRWSQLRDTDGRKQICENASAFSAEGANIFGELGKIAGHRCAPHGRLSLSAYPAKTTAVVLTLAI